SRTPTPWSPEELHGFGVYALERMPLPAARATLEHVVARLGELALRTPDGVAWALPEGAGGYPEEALGTGKTIITSAQRTARRRRWRSSPQLRPGMFHAR